jgi:YD repeat-containing protein
VKTTRVTDGRGRTVKLQQYGPTTLTTTFAYTPAGQLASMTDPTGASWSYGYDRRGNQITATDPDHGTTTATFDDAGQQLTSTDAAGRTLTTTYDPLGRRTSLRDGTSPRSEWSYDSGTGWTRPGLPSTTTRYLTGTATGTVVTKVTGYDAGDRPTGSATTVPAIAGVIESALAGTYTTTAAYNDDGSIKSSTIGNYGPIKGEKLTYGYDTNARPEYLTGAGSYVSDVIRAPYGEALRYGYGNTWANAAWERLRYQPGTRRLTDTWIDREAIATTDDHTTYAYDTAGNPKKIVTDRDLLAALPGEDETQCFDYDALRQLTAAWTPASGTCTPAEAATTPLGGPAPYSATWTFNNANGNRQSQDTRTGGPVVTATTSSAYTYTPGTHRLTAVAISRKSRIRWQSCRWRRPSPGTSRANSTPSAKAPP